MRTRKPYYNLILITLLAALLFSPLLAFAFLNTGGDNGGSALRGGEGFRAENPLGSDDGGGMFETLLGCDPDAGLLCFLQTILYFLLTVSVIIAVIFLVIGGYRYVTARGNDDAVEAAKKTITHSIVGMVVISAAWIILAIVLALFEAGNP